MTILTIIQQVCASCNLDVPTAAISATDPTITQLIALAQQEGDETASSFDWRNLKIGLSIVGDGTSTLFSLSPDFERFAPGQPLFSSAYPMVPLMGPIADDQLLALKALSYAPIRPFWRLIGGAIEIWPAIGSAETITGEYRSSFWILGADGVTRQSSFLSDNDVSLVPERIVKLGVIWRWKSAKGLDYAEDYRTWDVERSRVAGHDAGNKTIQMSRTFRGGLHTWPGVILDGTDPLF